VLQYVAVCCSVLQCVTNVKDNLEETEYHLSSILGYVVAVYCRVLQRVAVCCSLLQCVAVYCTVLLL